MRSEEMTDDKYFKDESVRCARCQAARGLEEIVLLAPPGAEAGPMASAKEYCHSCAGPLEGAGWVRVWPWVDFACSDEAILANHRGRTIDSFVPDHVFVTREILRGRGD
jgi:hypothetical protein